MVEDQEWQLVPGEGPRLPRIVAPHGLACRVREVDGGDGVQAGIPTGVAVGMELLDQMHVETGLLLCLPDRRGGE